MRGGRAALAAGMAAFTALAGSALAAPSANVSRGADATVYVRGAHGVIYYVGVRAFAAQQGTEAGATRLRVEIARCTADGCVDGLQYAGTIPARALTVADDLSSATLKTTFGGVVLSGTWASSGAPHSHGQVESGGTADFDTWAASGYSAAASIRIGQLRCPAEVATVATAAEASNPGPSAFYQPLPRALPPELTGRLACVPAP